MKILLMALMGLMLVGCGQEQQASEALSEGQTEKDMTISAYSVQEDNKFPLLENTKKETRAMREYLIAQEVDENLLEVPDWLLNGADRNAQEQAAA